MKLKQLCVLILSAALCAASPLTLASNPTPADSSASVSVEPEQVPTGSEPASSALSPEEIPAPEQEPELPDDARSAYETFMTSTCATNGHTPEGWISNGDGTMTAPCSLCGEAVTERCVMEETVIEPKCSIGGYTLHTCPLCAYSYQDHFTDPVPHDFVLTTDRKTGQTCYTCTFCGIGFRRAHDSLAVTFMDGRSFPQKLVDALEAYIEQKDAQINEELSPDEAKLKEMKADEVHFALKDRTEEDAEDPEASADEAETPSDSEESEDAEDGESSEESTEDITVDEPESLHVATDAASAITYLETKAFLDEEMDLSEEALKAEIDALYDEWYETSSELLTLPNPKAYKDEKDYKKDLAASLEAIEKGEEPVSLRDAVVKTAYDDLGHTGGSKYVNYYNKNFKKKGRKLSQSEPWCSEFATWCLFNSGVSTEVAPYFMSAPQGCEGFEKLDALHKVKSGKKYTPQPGDVGYFPNHSVLVISSDGKNFTTIERCGSTVRKRTRKISSAYAFGEVRYEIQSLYLTLADTDTTDWCAKAWEKDDFSQTIYGLLYRSAGQTAPTDADPSAE